MAITINRREEQIRKGQEMVRLSNAINAAQITRGQRARNLFESFQTFNPDPSNIVLRWPAEHNVSRRTMDGWEVVPPSDAHKYHIPTNDTDKGAGCIRRSGHILMRHSVTVVDGLDAMPIVEAIQQMDSDSKAWFKAAGNMARDVDHEKKLVKRRKVGKMSDDEQADLRAQKWQQQIRGDISRAISGAPVVATPDMVNNPLYGFLKPQGISVNDGVREVIMTDDPTRDLDYDFE